MNRNVLILIILAAALIIALVVNFQTNKEKKSQKLEQLQSDVKDIEKIRDEAMSKVGKDDQKLENIEKISEELIRQKKQKMEAYQEKE